MRFINIRNFIRDFKEELEDLPLVVTRYGKPICTVIPPGPGLTVEGHVADLRGAKSCDAVIEEFWVKAPKEAVEEATRKRKAIEESYGPRTA